MKRILVSLSIIGIVAAIAIGATTAYFSDTETSTGNTFTAGTLDLVVDIDGQIYNPLNRPIFTEPDIKPGDSGEETISLHVDNDACGSVKFDLTSDEDNTCTEPEADDEGIGCPLPGGELNDEIKWAIWKDEGDVMGWQCGFNVPGCVDDLKEGDNKQTGAYDTTLLTGTLTGDRTYGFGEMLASKGYYYGFAWNLPTTVDNIVQSDSFTADMILKVEQKKNQHAVCPFGEIVGDWHFDEGTGKIAYDSSGYGNHGTISGATWTGGVSGNALSFDGNNDYVNAGNDSSLDITGNIMVEAWIYPTRMDSYDTILVKGTNSGNYAYFLAIGTAYNNSLSFQLGGVGGIQTGTVPINLNQWNYVLGLRQGNKMRTYVNGVLSKEATVGIGNIRTNTLPVEMGRYGVAGYFNGVIDEVKVYAIP